jgi:DNA-binding LacI/PurR family transcriptional regulator
MHLLCALPLHRHYAREILAGIESITVSAQVRVDYCANLDPYTVDKTLDKKPYFGLVTMAPHGDGTAFFHIALSRNLRVVNCTSDAQAESIVPCIYADDQGACLRIAECAKAHHFTSIVPVMSKVKMYYDRRCTALGSSGLTILADFNPQKHTDDNVLRTWRKALPGNCLAVSDDVALGDSLLSRLRPLTLPLISIGDNPVQALSTTPTISAVPLDFFNVGREAALSILSKKWGGYEFKGHPIRDIGVEE